MPLGDTVCPQLTIASALKKSTPEGRNLYPREYFDTCWRPELRDEVFVAMSFADEFSATWTDIIRPAIEDDLKDLGLTAVRVDISQICGSIVTDIMEGIARSRVVLAEVSTASNGQRNANVLYEVGLAQALRLEEEVILFRRDVDPLNFDLAPIRVLSYSPDDVEQSRGIVADAVRHCLREIDLRKGLKVRFAMESLDDGCLSLMKEGSLERGFSISSPLTMERAAVVLPRRLSVLKMLDLGIIRTDANMATNEYLYHWTSFGKAVMRALGLEVNRSG